MIFNLRIGCIGYGYLYSFDFEGVDDVSRMLLCGCCSNSSLGFQFNFGWINSMCEMGILGVIYFRGGKGSKSSSINSIDQGYVQVLGSQ